MPKPKPQGADILALDQLKPDPQNRRRRTVRSAELLVDALKDVGAARSIVIDEDGEVLAGNGVVEAAAKAGINKVQIIDADRDTLIAVRRRGLNADEKRRLAMYDNRTAELSEWDRDQLAADLEQGLDLQAFFSESELADVLDEPSEPRQAVVEEVDTTPVADTFWIAIRGPLERQAYALKRLRELMADLDGVSVELGTVATATDDEA